MARLEGMAWLAGVLVIGACYSPAAPSGAPCASGETGAARCPAGLVCVARDGTEVCLSPDEALLDAPINSVDGEKPDAPPADAASDAPAGDHDEDEDGIADLDDNCPGIANTAQTDNDADQVGDACDPHPQEAKDHLRLFVGFEDGIPPTWGDIGDWSALDGDARVAVMSGERTFLYAPMTPTDHSTTSTRVTPTLLQGAARGIGVTALGNPDDAADGVVCEILTTGNTNLLALISLKTTDIFASAPYAWTIGETYTLTVSRDTTHYQCTVNGPAGPLTVNGERADPLLMSARVGLRTISANASFEWLQYVTSDN